MPTGQHAHTLPHTHTQVLTQELDTERERRWKAEQAAGKLVEHVRTLQSQRTEAKRRHELAVVRVAQLEREVEGEREGAQTLQSQVQELQVCMCVCVWGVRVRRNLLVVLSPRMHSHPHKLRWSSYDSVERDSRRH